MSLRILHTSDWHIAKPLGLIPDDARREILREARLAAITTIGNLAREHLARVVVVAGDTYDHDRLGEVSLAQPLERMRACPWAAWHLIPGNHDPDRVGGVWERVGRRGLPDNVRLHLEPAPQRLNDAAWLLPAPLRRSQCAGDPTAWMDDAPTPAGAIRVGLAHGQVLDFGRTPNLIDPARPQAAGLDYLALGDRHGRHEVGRRCWYSGTPEPDGFEGAGGEALLVDLPGAGAPPVVTPLATGRYHWHRMRIELHGPEDIELVDRTLRQRLPDPARLVVDLEVRGALSLRHRQRFEAKRERLHAALGFLRIDDRALLSRPSREDLDAIAPSGVLRDVAVRLVSLLDGSGEIEPEVAERALMRLLVEHERTPPP